MRSSVSSCVDEDEMVRFVAGKLAGAQRAAVIEHVDECGACRAVAAELARAEVSPHETAPELGDNACVDGRFRLHSVLGRGAMGVVYRARDEKLDVDIAIKIFPYEKQDRSSFARELTVGRRVTHPNVCRLYDAGTFGDRAFITMELIVGATLAETLASSELAKKRALAVLADIAAGLAAVHAEGIVHRDLKPANVLLESASGRAILTDFGFAADLKKEQSRRLVGTPAFWSPEQARGEPPTPASDVYSFGLIAYRLLARRDFSLSASDFGAVPPGYRALVARCLESKPKRRFTDGAATLRALARTRHAGLHWWLAVPMIALVLIALWQFARPRPSPQITLTIALPEMTLPASASSVAVAPIVSAHDQPMPNAPGAEKSTETNATPPRIRHPLLVQSVAPPATASTTPPAVDPLYRH